MKVQHVVPDPSCIGLKEFKYDDKTLFYISARTLDTEVALMLTGYEMDSLKNLVWRRI